MTTYEAICAANGAIIRREPIDEAKRRDMAAFFLAQADKNAAERLRGAIHCQPGERSRYPLFYAPPYGGGKKLRTLTGELPKTHLFAANHYELEILRLLTLWQGENPAVKAMAEATIRRLDDTCFGRFCPTGECVGAGVAALRFLSAACPADHRRLDRLLRPLGDLFRRATEKGGEKGELPLFYFLLTISELDDPYALELVDSRRDYLYNLLCRGWLTGPSPLDTYNILRKVVLKNALGKLEAYKYLEQAAIVVSPKDGRCYCDADAPISWAV
jgi:hypothetical protein